MKKQLFTGLLILVFFSGILKIEAQISLGTSDMPHKADTFRLSSGVIDPQLDPISTGAGITWDFSNLIPLMQRIDSFVAPSSTNMIYAFFFGFSSNLAYKVYTPDSIGPIKPAEAFNFYNNTSSSYKQIGYASIINATPLPIKYDTADLIYKFPLQYTNKDSSRSSYKIDIPNMAYYGHSQKRVNEVDGWGTLKTPFGTFPVIRVKSIIMGRDTFAYNGLPGISINRPLSVEYKWLGQGQGVPLLQINISQNLGISSITSVLYRDSARVGVPVLGINEKDQSSMKNLSVYPNPAGKETSLSYTLLRASRVKIEMRDLSGKLEKIISNTEQLAGNYTVSQSINDMPSGTYLLNFIVNDILLSSQKLIVVK